MHEAVLVLNANFEPLNVCDTRRALGLIITGKAELVANGRGYIHTTRAQYPRPSVIRLGQIIRRPRPRVPTGIGIRSGSRAAHGDGPPSRSAVAPRSRTVKTMPSGRRDSTVTELP